MPHRTKIDIKVMPTSDGQIVMKYKDVFDFKLFYEDFHEYLIENDWVDDEDKLDHFETFYGERVDRNGMKELWIEWRVTKKVLDAPYLKYFLDFNFHIIALTETEIIRDGLKMRANKGEIELKVLPSITRTYNDKFEKIPLFKELKTLFNRRIYRETLEQRKKELYQETYAFQNWFKQWFQLKRHLPYQEIKDFFPSRAWPSHMKN